MSKTAEFKFDFIDRFRILLSGKIHLKMDYECGTLTIEIKAKKTKP